MYGESDQNWTFAGERRKEKLPVGVAREIEHAIVVIVRTVGDETFGQVPESLTNGPDLTSNKQWSFNQSNGLSILGDGRFCGKNQNFFSGGANFSCRNVVLLRQPGRTRANLRRHRG